MALESVTNIADLNPANPSGSDAKAQGDDHVRNIKTALVNNLVGFTGAIRCTGVDGGAANAYTLTPARALIGYSPRLTVLFSPTATNTGASTLNISGLGAVPLRSVVGADFVAGELATGSVYAAVYNGSEFRLQSVTKTYVDQRSFSSALPNQSLGWLRSDGSAASWTQTHTGYAQNEVLGAPIASAATINLTTATGNLVHVTGTATIMAITIPSGAEREVVFDGALILTNSANLILPTGANIATAAGDTMRVRGDGAGVARVVDYCRASGNALIKPAMLLVAGPLTPSAAANVDFLNVFTSQFDEYLVQINGVQVAATSTKLMLQFAVGGAVDAGAANYQYGQLDDTTLGTASASGILISGAGYVGNPVTATVRLSGINSALANVKALNSLSICTNTSGSAPLVQGFVGAHRPAGAASGFRLYWASGASFTATGTIKVYGVLNS